MFLLQVRGRFSRDWACETYCQNAIINICTANMQFPRMLEKKFRTVCNTLSKFSFSSFKLLNNFIIYLIVHRLKIDKTIKYINTGTQNKNKITVLYLNGNFCFLKVHQLLFLFYIKTCQTFLLTL